MTDLHHLTATEQVTALAKSEVSSVELVSHYLDRIERFDPETNVFVTVFAEDALAAAREADAGVVCGEDLGPLHGLPLALKDLHPAAGLRTTFGSVVFADMIPAADGPAIANLRRAGAVFIGKTNTPEFGPACYTDSAVGGTTVTPYGEGLSASGSSGGAAAAVAAGLVGLAHGSDSLGSIRTPAANCGLVGFKVSRGRAGFGVDWLGLGSEGPLARTVADAALFLDAMGGPADSDLWHQPGLVANAFTSAAAASALRPLRIGRLTTTGLDLTVDPACLAAVDGAATTLAGAGHVIEDIPSDALPDVSTVRPAIKVVLSATIGLIVGSVVPADQRYLLMPYTRWLAESDSFSALDLVAAEATLRLAALGYRQLLNRYDLIISPTTTAPPVPTSALRCDDADESFRAMGRWSAFTPAANLAGVPAVSVPVHRTGDGLPIGAEIVGPPGADELLMSVAAQMEDAVGWADHHPPVWNA